jgi:predicted amidophosphoribosyltransferase
MPLEEFFQAADVLVPVPGRRAGAVRMSDAPFQLAEQLARRGLGCSIWPGLVRNHEIPKTASAPPGARPTIATQLGSLGVVANHRPAVEGLLLIDDVVSRGRTLLAAALRLKEAFPHARVRAFALIRTLGLISDVAHVLDPCIGHIRLRRGDASREP